MSRRSVPDSPWQNGMPPFGFCQQPFSPMMNCGPMWAGQSNLPFMGGSIPPDMMRFGGNVPPRSYFRRSFDQPPERYRSRQGFNDRYGNRQGYGRGDRKRPGPSDRSRSPASKRATQRRDGARRAEEERETREGASEGEAAAAEEEAAEDGAAQADDLYDPAEPTTEDTVEGAEVAEGQEDESGDVNQAGGNEDGGEEAGTSADKDETGGGEAGPSTSAAKSSSKSPAKPVTKATVPKTSETKAPSKAADGKGQAGGRPSDKGRQEQGPRRSGQKDKGWCTVCEIHFDGSFLDHRRTEDHKIKRDEKYPKCHACSMGFNNPKQYEHHCAGDLHRKNVEVLDNEVDETAGPLGEEYLEEVRAYYCTLCKLLLKVDLKSHHCCTQGHYRRHRDLKRKEEATKKAKLAKEKAEEEEDDTNQVTYTITDEVGSDDEARAASDAAAGMAKRIGPGEGTSEPKQDEADEAQQEVSEEHPEGEHDVEQPEASEDKTEPPKGEGDNEQRAQQEEEEREDASELEAASAAASLLDEQKESDAADRNGCKGPEEDADEQNAAAVTPATTAARPAATSAATAGVPKATVSKLPPAKVAVKKVPAAKPTAAVTKPSATASKVPPPKAGTAANSAAPTTGRAPSGAAAAKTPVAPAASAAATTPGRGGMVRGRGRGLPPKAVRARKR